VLLLPASLRRTVSRRLGGGEGGKAPLAAEMDTVLHEERLDRGRKRLHAMPGPVGELPDGAVIAAGGEASIARGQLPLERAGLRGEPGNTSRRRFVDPAHHFTSDPRRLSAGATSNSRLALPHRLKFIIAPWTYWQATDRAGDGLAHPTIRVDSRPYPRSRSGHGCICPLRPAGLRSRTSDGIRFSVEQKRNVAGTAPAIRHALEG